MKREDILKEYKVNTAGIITSPGKFESEMIYVPYFWNLFLEGCGDTCEDHENCTSIELDAFDVEFFPELESVIPTGEEMVHLTEDEYGFVYCTIV